MTASSLDLIKGTLDVLILKTLSHGARHGYGISRWIRETTDEAFDVDEGALYPALRRLQKRGYLDAEWGTTDTGREAKFYRLTAEGEAELERGLSHWHRYVRAMGQVLGTPGAA